MALLKLGGLITKISGKIGGQIMGTSNSGNYIKSNSYSQNPNTPNQSRQKAKIGLISQLWRNLTQAQRNAWESGTTDYPYINRVGDTVFYTGFSLFNKLNLNRQVLELPPNLSIPTFTPISLPNFTISQNPSNVLIITWSSGVIGSTISIFTALYQDSSLNPKKSNFLLTKIYTLPSASGSIGIETDYENIFGVIPSNSYVFARIKAYDTNSGNVTEFSDIDSVLFI